MGERRSPRRLPIDRPSGVPTRRSARSPQRVPDVLVGDGGRYRSAAGGSGSGARRAAVQRALPVAHRRSAPRQNHGQLPGACAAAGVTPHLSIPVPIHIRLRAAVKAARAGPIEEHDHAQANSSHTRCRGHFPADDLGARRGGAPRARPARPRPRHAQYRYRRQGRLHGAGGARNGYRRVRARGLDRRSEGGNREGQGAAGQAARAVLSAGSCGLQRRRSEGRHRGRASSRRR